jgi:hypothetical protein
MFQVNKTPCSSQKKIGILLHLLPMFVRKQGRNFATTAGTREDPIKSRTAYRMI